MAACFSGCRDLSGSERDSDSLLVRGLNFSLTEQTERPGPDMQKGQRSHSELGERCTRRQLEFLADRANGQGLAKEERKGFYSSGM